MTQTAAAAEAPKEAPKDASASVVAQQAAMLDAACRSPTPPISRTRRAASRELLQHAWTANPQGRVVGASSLTGF